jgi:hypothetical protein
LRGPMHLCACVSEERSNGEGAGSQALYLLSDSIFWEHQSAYTVTMQLNTARSNAADIQNAQNHTHTTPTPTRAGQAPRHPADRALCPPSRRRFHARRISPALPAIRVAFAPGVPVVNSHVRLLHLQFLHFITPTRQAPCQSLLHHTLLHLPYCTSKFRSARCRAHSLRVAAECPPP